MRLMEKLGMKREGVQRSQVKNPAGEWADLYLYGILREEKEEEEKRGEEKGGSQALERHRINTSAPHNAAVRIITKKFKKTLASWTNSIY